jgi:hypothetical protein
VNSASKTNLLGRLMAHSSGVGQGRCGRSNDGVDDWSLTLVPIRHIEKAGASDIHFSLNPNNELDAMTIGIETEDSKAVSHEGHLRLVMSWISVVLVTVTAIASMWKIITLGYQQHVWLDILRKQFAAVIGLPAAALVALFLVLVLRMADGPIETEIGGLKFKGAAAPIVFWLLCFLSIAVAIKLLWIK